MTIMFWFSINHHDLSIMTIIMFCAGDSTVPVADCDKESEEKLSMTMQEYCDYWTARTPGQDKLLYLKVSVFKFLEDFNT